MILQALLERYEDMAATGDIPAVGWGNVNISLALTLAPDGQLLHITDVKTEQLRGKKTVVEKQLMTVPAPVNRTAGVLANFLWDNATYLLGVDSKGKPERAQKCFAACAALHHEVLSNVDHPAAQAILAFFDGWDACGAENHPALVEFLEELKTGANLVFRLDGAFAHTIPALRDAWQNYKSRDEGGLVAPCLVTGRLAPTARLHPSIKGVRGAQTMGVPLVSFNTTAVESYGKEQGCNAPVSEYAAFAYATALNQLLADREHVQHLGDATVVFWSKGGNRVYQDMAALFLGGGGAVDELRLKNAMEHLAQGRVTQWEETTVDPATPFYILGLSPNAARLSVRFFLCNTFGDFARHIAQHQARLEIVRPAYDTRQQLAFWELLRETVNPKSKEKVPAPVMASDTLRAIFTGGDYPASLLQGVSLRIRAERNINRDKAAIIKAYYLKKPHKDCPKEVLTVSLNETCTDVSYTLGRLFSVLESIQQAANPNINATIKDRYFNAASATPSIVFPTLINLSQKHLRKLSSRWTVHFDKQITALLAILPGGSGYPTRLTLPQQGAFQLGYYHQRQAQFATKKEEQ